MSVASFALAGAAVPTIAQQMMNNEHTVTVGGAPMYPSKVTIQNVFQSNGVSHVVDSVLIPSA